MRLNPIHSGAVIFKKDFKFAKQRCKACKWDGVRAKLKILFANSAEHFM
jgi:hypothetical protein